MFRTRSPLCIVLLSVGLFPLAQGGTALGSDLVVDSSVLFSTLDGSANDQDGVVNGVLTLDELSIEDRGAILIDVPEAHFIVSNDVNLEDQGAIRTPALPAAGPILVIRAGSSVVNCAAVSSPSKNEYTEASKPFGACFALLASSSERASSLRPSSSAQRLA